MIRQWEPTIVLGRDDQGREMTLEAFDQAIGTEGYKYELIDGRVEVSPAAEMPHESLAVSLLTKLLLYRLAHPDVINHVSPSARVHVPARTAVTCPEPDIAVYSDYPHHLPARQRRWQNVSPILVIEVISPETAAKDLERNVALYLEVPSIREYWIVDQREDSDYPSIIVYRRRGAKWQKPIRVAPGEIYTTKFLPDFQLKLDAPAEER